MTDGLLNKLLHEDEDSDEKNSPQSEDIKGDTDHSEGQSKKGKMKYILPILVFLMALIPRLSVLFLTDPQSPGWYDDTFHHWQIAYLSKEIGFHHGFLRLWDFKGMEYFWGLLHPLVLVVLFAVTGSVSIVIPRLLTIFCGSMVITLIFLLVRRYFNTPSALSAAIFASFMPVVIYSDTAGLQEPLALLILLAGIYYLRKKPLLCGFLFALAGMVRAEYWLFGAGLFTASLLSKEKFDHKVMIIIGWIIPTLLYMKYLLNQTGNAIYPIYWNFLASVKGEWFANVSLSPTAQSVQMLSKIAFVIGAGLAVFILLKRPRYYLLFLLGIGNILFLGFMLGFGAYIRGYMTRYWVDRLFSWPYAFVGILVSVFLLYYLPSKIKSRYFIPALGWILVFLFLLSTQLAWPYINGLAKSARGRLNFEKQLAEGVARNYHQGVILVPEDRPQFIYFLVHDFKISGKNITGEMFDPYFYFKEDPYKNWDKYREVIIDWLRKGNVKLMVTYSNRQRYQNLIKKEPGMFKFIEERSGIQIYEVIN